jgi:hypothetical protein
LRDKLAFIRKNQDTKRKVSFFVMTFAQAAEKTHQENIEYVKSQNGILKQDLESKLSGNIKMK